ncbi:D-alanine--D-alanine ligase, partial [bacterium]|nr:D-alanine--D-alanine ligase [bacterium]
MSAQEKIQVAVLFGGRSTEHEISIITALQILDAFDATRFDAFPVYVDQDGYWFLGEALRQRDFYIPAGEKKDKLQRVQLTCDPEPQLVAFPKKAGLLSKPKQIAYPVDVFFPAFHGTYGEDGCIQGILEFIGVPYTGCGPRAASIGMNKFTCKMLLGGQDIPVLPDLLLIRNDWDPQKSDVLADEILHSLSLPLIVKPCNLGSSVAVSSATTKDELMISLAGAFAFDHQIIVEPLLEDFYELNISVFHGNPPRLSAIERPKREEDVLTYEQKYLQGNNKKTGADQGMASMQRDIEPADVPEEIKQQVKDCAIKAFRLLDARGVVRFDYLVDKKSGNVYFNEINTLPGSLAYYLWE